MSIATGYVSYSELSAFQQCPLKHHLEYTVGLAEPPEKRRPALALGTAFHAMLEARYREWVRADREGETRSHQRATPLAWEAVDALVASGREALSGEQIEQLAWMWSGYDEAYGIDREWEILAVEMRLDERLCRVGNRWIRLKGRVDLLVRDRASGRIYLVDFKTMKGKDASGAAWGRERDLDAQFVLYQALLRHLGVDATGAIYAAIRTDQLKRKMESSERFGRHLVLRNDEAMDRALANAVATVRSIAAMSDQRRSPLPVYSSPNPSECGWKCSFKEVHIHADNTGEGYEQVARDWGFVDRYAGREPAA